MATKYRKPNRNRQIAPEGYCEQSRLEDLLQRVRYSGHPQHKRNPGDFGLTPPSAPKPGKSLCDDAGIVTKAAALSLLKEGLRRGTVCPRWKEGWPLHIWSMTENGIVLESKRGNAEGVYHSYPLPPRDYIAVEMQTRWAGV